MSEDKSSLLTEVHHFEPSQTTNVLSNNQDIKKDDLGAGTANDSVATRIFPSNESNPTPRDVQTTTTRESSTTQAPDSDVSEHATARTTHDSDVEKPEVQHVEPSQTANVLSNNQDIKKDDLVAGTSNESATASTTPILDPSSDSVSTRISPRNESNSTPRDVQTPESSTIQSPDSYVEKPATESSTTQIPDSDANNQSTTITAADHSNSLPTELSTSKTPDSDANKQANTMGIDDSSKSSTTMDPTSNRDSNSVNQTNPPTTSNATNQTTNQSTQTTNNDSPKISTTMVPTTNQDSNAVAQTNPPAADNEAQQATNQSIETANTELQTNQDDHGNPLPTDETSTSQNLDSDANKQANTAATDDSPKSSTTMVPTSNQDSNVVDQNTPPTADGDTKKDTNQTTQELTASTDSQINMTLLEVIKSSIDQELNSLRNVFFPKLSDHERRIKEDTDKASEQFEKLKKENCDLKQFKDFKKVVIKLKLQIPVMYRTYEEGKKEKHQKSNVENRSSINITLRKKMPRLHDKLFSESPICKTIHLRFNQLDRELKLCLLCFLVFPENAIISRRLMIYWWIGEGIIPREDDDAEDCANEFFIELMEKDFIEPVSRSYGRYVAICKMNPMVRAALVMIADKLKFFDFDAYGNPKDFGKFREIKCPEDLPGFYPPVEPREFFVFFDANRESISEPICFFDSEGKPCQFISLAKDSKIVIPESHNEKKKIYYYYRKSKITTKSYRVCLMSSGLSESIPWENLHILFNLEATNLEFRPEWFLQMKNVNVMCLGRWQRSVDHRIEIEEFEFEKSLDNMNHVRFFSLQGVSRISRLPDSISKLKSLLILDLRACHNLEVIPETIGSLNCLTHLDISECYLLNKMPKAISSLESLQVLKGFVVVKSPGRDICTLKDLTKLVNLRKLHMYTHMKSFPEESHLDDLENFETLTKLTILWRGHESLSHAKKFGKKKKCFSTKVKRLIRRKNWVEGSMKRMNAFGSSTLGLRLEKLDIRCFPRGQKHNWLTAGNFKGLKKLYIRGGFFSDLGEYQDILQWDDSSILPKETWNVEILRLKYLEELSMEWRELQSLFPKLKSFEKVKCPRLTFFPCNEQGIWTKKE